LVETVEVFKFDRNLLKPEAKGKMFLIEPGREVRLFQEQSGLRADRKKTGTKAICHSLLNRKT